MPRREATGWGGKRKGAGRKKKPGSGLPHRMRPLLASRFPVHVTMKVVSDLPDLRAKPQLQVIEDALRAALGRHGLNIAHYSIQENHLHFIAEAKDRDVLMKGLRGLAIRLARRLNDTLGRHGRVFADRYHQRILRTPSETRHAVAQVLQNRRKDVAPVPPSGEPTVGEPRTWLLQTGWKLRGKLPTDEVPES
ncbi:MAG: hypothetical protein IT371_26175 [Deltaproteobacteria bacterium]|nr:hypothetical protein [Deltaproteobacteria bacterium]